MKKLNSRINALALKIKSQLHNFKENEDGMEIITILVLLALALALIGVLIGFRNQIMDRVQELFDGFMQDF